MVKLKTLKEFACFCSGTQYPHNASDCNQGVVKLENLKEEAIKWVKSDCTIDHNHWVCNFFNITEEDLQ